jgi:homoserine dehydrogenase
MGQEHGFERNYGNKLSLLNKNQTRTKYYLRLEVADKTGVLAKVASILGDCGISIEKMLQKPLGNQKSNLFSSNL